MEKTLSDQPKPSVDVRHQALEWLIRLEDEHSTAEDYAAWMEWMEKDRMHRVAFDKASSIWGAIAKMDQLSILINPQNEVQRKESTLLPKQSWYSIFNCRPGWIISSISCIIVLFMVSVLVDVKGYFRNHEQTYSTETAEIRKEVLPDNSTIILGAQTTIKVSYSRNKRRITFLKGEAYFSVRKDLHRPFYVTASYLSVKVVGTEFEIDKGAEAINVAVLKGKVNVSANTNNNVAQFTTNNADTKVLHKGQQVTSTMDGVLGPAKPIPATSSPASWRSGFLLYEDAFLKDVIADISRYYKGVITLSSESIGELKVTASFKTDQIEEALQSLDKALPIEIVRRKQKGHLLLVAKSSK